MKWLVGAALLIGLGFLMLAFAYPSVTIRYRLTLEAMVDGQPRTGGAVIEVTYQKQPSIGAVGRDVAPGIRGEAVVLDLGSRNFLFALLKEGSDPRSGPQSIVLRAFDISDGVFPGWDPNSMKALQNLSGKRELSLTSLPLLVRFRDLNDPKSVEVVDPLDIGKSFGPGAKLVRAAVEIVPAGVWPFSRFDVSGEPITRGIEATLPWLNDLKGSYLDGGFTSRNAPLGLHGGNFKTGI